MNVNGFNTYVWLSIAHHENAHCIFRLLISMTRVYTINKSKSLVAGEHDFDTVYD